DERHCIDRLCYLLDTYAGTSVQVVAAPQTIDEGVNAIHRLKPDLVFLDIQVFDQTAFDLLSRVAGIDFEIVFTTAYEKYAEKAFKFSAIDYLLKPIDRDDLRSALERVRDKISQTDRTKKFHVLFGSFRNVN